MLNKQELFIITRAPRRNYLKLMQQYGIGAFVGVNRVLMHKLVL